MVFNLLLKPQIYDTQLQDQYVRESGLDWTITQPVHLTDEELEDEKLFSSMINEVANWSITRNVVGQFNAEATFNHNMIGKTVTLSSAS